MRAVFRTSATIVTILAAMAAAGCGQRGPLSLPVVPPMPQPPGSGSVPASGVDDTSPGTLATPEDGAASDTPSVPPLPMAPLDPQNNGGLTPLPTAPLQQ
jgi:predicted small lipoprotein YifL